MESPVLSRPATVNDLEAMTETMVLAFAGDPVWGGWAFPDRDRAKDQRRAFFSLWLGSALRYGAARVTQNCEAVAAWYPPGASENTEEDERRLIATAMSLLGTHDRHRGKGLGMGLLRENLGRIDAAGLPAYPESTNPVNLPRYERPGFAKIGAYVLPGAGPRIDMMWREAVKRPVSPGGAGPVRPA